MHDEKPRQRLKRLERVAEKERPAMRLTERDLEIIRTVNDCRVLLGEQIERLFFGSRSTAQYRLERLFQHEYLDGELVQLPKRPPASNPAAYYVGTKGVQLLIDHFHYDLSHIRRPKKAQLGWRFLDHLLALNDVRIAVMQAAGQNQFELGTWLDEKHFRSRPDYVTLTDKRGRERQYPIFPDGYFSLIHPQGKARFFVEIDRGQESLSKFAPQIRAYDAYVQSGLYQERFKAKSLRILVVTSTKRRVKTLMRVTERVGGDRKYCFTTFDQVNAESVLTGAIWQRLGTDEAVSLVQTGS